MIRWCFLVTGQVQGVGFRPFVYRVARELGLTGHVGNTSQGVRIEVQGNAEAVEHMHTALTHDLPPLARVVTLLINELSVCENETSFVIAPSHGEASQSVLVSPDMGTCAACQAELFDPANRRHDYPFINCTDCGPRFTITRSIPYDRATTSMSCFPLCEECAAEYTDPANRRFHAQPNACPVCGPRLWTTRTATPSTHTAPPAGTHHFHAALSEIVQALADGQIAAVKGLGGFHLVCDARNVQALARLRERKQRPHQSLAIMVADMAGAHALAFIAAEEATELASARRPIVVVQRRTEAGGGLPDLVAPDVPTVGLMLPYTPLHHVLVRLFAAHTGDKAALVMTSGNPGGEPLCLGNREAQERLGAVADLFVLHDRDIVIRADDSVLRVLTDEQGTTTRQFFRRARGFVPEPVTLPEILPEKLSGTSPCVLAVGAELKNTLCLTRGNDAFVSQHHGDVKNLETSRFFQQSVQHFMNLLEVNPALTVCDLHPDYLTTVWARDFAAERGLPLLAVQHHAAHVHSALAEHGHTGPALGLALDGMGYGTDGTIWGGELLLVHPAQAGRECAPQLAPASGNTLNTLGHTLPGGVRLGRLAPFALPGGDAATREPWRIAAALLAGSALAHEPLATPWLAAGDATHKTHAAIMDMANLGYGVHTSSCGRLFDAVAALLGLCSRVTYEGQAAIRLESCQDVHEQGQLEPRLSVGERSVNGVPVTLCELDAHHLFMQAAEQRVQGVPVPIIARRFHAGLAEGFARLALWGAEATGVRTVALSGGVLFNRTLAEALPRALQQLDLVPLCHALVPPGDGGLSLGQAAWGRFWLQNRE